MCEMCTQMLANNSIISPLQNVCQKLLWSEWLYKYVVNERQSQKLELFTHEVHQLFSENTKLLTWPV